jgi:lipopolysaccharide export system permease protein
LPHPTRYAAALMRLLDRYLLRELLIPLVYCLGGFLTFYVSFDLIGNLRRFQDAHLLFRDGLEYYLVTTPELLVFPLIPVSLMLALLYALTNHARHNELTAMRAAGVGMWRLSLPYLAVGLTFSLALFWLNETLVPYGTARAEQILRRRLTNAQDRSWHANLKFRNEQENRSWDARNFNLITGEMIKPSIIWEMPDGSRREIYAQRATYANPGWIFHDVEQWTKSPQDIAPVSSSTNLLRANFPETPELIRSDIKINSMNLTKAAKGPQLSLAEIADYQRLHPKLNATERAKLETQRQGRFAEPWKCLMVVLIALPFGARSGRRNVFVGVASSIFICFGYLILQKFSLALGTANYLPSVIAAWLPNAFFGIAGIVLTCRVR